MWFLPFLFTFLSLVPGIKGEPAQDCYPLDTGTVLEAEVCFPEGRGGVG